MRVLAAFSITRRISGGRMFGIYAGLEASWEETEKGGSDLALHGEEVQNLDGELDGLDGRAHVRLARLGVVRGPILPLGTKIRAHVSLHNQEEQDRGEGGGRAYLEGDDDVRVVGGRVLARGAGQGDGVDRHGHAGLTTLV
jgi:hypothetical protein